MSETKSTHSKIETTPEMAKAVYQKTQQRLSIIRQRLGRSLTLAEKVLFGHLDDPQNQELKRGESFLLLRPDRVATRDG
jgi:aconitate hydratase